jgi:hypothetical protein
LYLLVELRGVPLRWTDPRKKKAPTLDVGAKSFLGRKHPRHYSVCPLCVPFDVTGVTALAVTSNYSSPVTPRVEADANLMGTAAVTSSFGNFFLAFTIFSVSASYKVNK